MQVFIWAFLFRWNYNFKTIRPSLDPEERTEQLDSRKSLLEKVKKYIDAELNQSKVHVIDPEKENYKPPSTIDEIL